MYPKSRDCAVQLKTLPASCLKDNSWTLFQIKLMVLQKMLHNVGGTAERRYLLTALTFLTRAT